MISVMRFQPGGISKDDLHFRSSDFDNNETPILERYKNYNGVQGNSPTSEQSTEEYPTSSTNLPEISLSFIKAVCNFILVRGVLRS